MQAVTPGKLVLWTSLYEGMAAVTPPEPTLWTVRGRKASCNSSRTDTMDYYEEMPFVTFVFFAY